MCQLTSTMSTSSEHVKLWDRNFLNVEIWWKKNFNIQGHIIWPTIFANFLVFTNYLIYLFAVVLYFIFCNSRLFPTKGFLIWVIVDFFFIIFKCFYLNNNKILHAKKKFFRSGHYTWKMRHVLKRLKNKFSDCFDFYFLSYGRFCNQNSSKNWPILST